MGADPLERESPADRRARIFVRQRRRRRWLSLVILLVLILASGSGLLAAYRWIARTPETSDVPLIRADDQPTRKRPSEPGGMAVPDQDSLVLNRTEPKTERLLPPPESPLPRPAPAPAAPASDTPAASAPATSAPPPVAAPNAASTRTAATPETAPPSAPPSPPSPPRVGPKPTIAALPPSAAAPRAAAPAGKGYRLQLGSVRTPNEAKAEWERLRQQNQDVLGALGFTPERADLGSRGVYYRIQAGPLADAASAERACNELKRRGVGCLLVKP